jgi:hypothetical protein
MDISRTIPSMTLAFLTVLLLSMPLGARAAQNSTDTHQEIVKVVAHLPLTGMRVNQMFVQQRDAKLYLYLHRPSKDAFALVDVSDPRHPVLLSRHALKEGAGGQVQGLTAGSVLAVSVTPEQSEANTQSDTVKLPTETVRLVDMSDPKNPKSVKTFKGVTSVYPDDARKLVYLVNADGLWIVSHHMTHPLPLCTSDDSLNPEPECQ